MLPPESGDPKDKRAESEPDEAPDDQDITVNVPTLTLEKELWPDAAESTDDEVEPREDTGLDPYNTGNDETSSE